MKGFRKIFRFTLKQQLAVKTVKWLTIIVAAVLFLVPALTMTLIELKRDGTPSYTEDPDRPGENPKGYSADGVGAVYYAADTQDGFSWTSLEQVHLPGYEKVPFTLCKTVEEAAEKAAGDDGSLILLIKEEEDHYVSLAMLPTGSALATEKAEHLASAFADSRNVLILLESGMTEEQILEVLAPIPLRLFETPAGEGEDIPSDGPADIETEEDFAQARDILASLLPYLNIMVIYFLVLYYGQSVANSVILEKNSKLMDTFLVAVDPKAMILGKVVATWIAALIQFLSWVAALIAGFCLGTFLVKTINPNTPMELLSLFEVLGRITKILSAPAICIAVLLILGGFFVYCTLAAIAGSFASKPEELSSTIGYFTLTLVVSMFITLEVGFISRSLDAGARWYDFVPFTSTLITPSRVLLGYLSLGGGLLALLAMLVLSGLFIRLAGKTYTMMSLYKGNVPKLPDVLRMLKG